MLRFLEGFKISGSLQQADAFALAGGIEIGIEAGKCRYAVELAGGEDEGVVGQQVVFPHEINCKLEHGGIVGQPSEKSKKW